MNLDRDTGDEAYPLDLPDGCADTVRASHLLEHFSHRGECDAVLADWVRVLKPGGLLKIAVPDAEWLAKALLERRDGVPITSYMMGGHTDENDVHRSMWWRDQLEYFMDRAGLVGIEEWEPDCEDCCDLPVSLRLQGRKPDAKGTDLPQAAANPQQAPFAWMSQEIATNRYSQSGEDGVLEALFAHIGTENRWCVEVGAHDGTTFSNTKKLIEEGWNAVLIECDARRFDRLCDSINQAAGAQPSRDVSVSERVRGKGWTIGGQAIYAVNALVTPDGECSLDSILRHVGCPVDPDLVCIDVDGQDYFIWNGLLHHKPRVVLCEFAPQGDGEGDHNFIPPLGGMGQAGRSAIIRLGVGKDYRPIAQLGVNMLFVRSQIVKRMQAEEDIVKPAAAATEPACDKIGADVRAVMTVPRLTFSDNSFCAMQAFVPLGISLERTGGVFWDQGIEKALGLHLSDGTKYVLTLDFDTVFCRDDVVALYRAMEEHPEADALVPLQHMRESAFMLFMPGDHIERKDKQCCVPKAELMAEIMPINSGHFGLTLLRVDALKRLPRPWFLAKPAPDGSWGEGHMDADIAFWAKWRESGNSIYLANRVPIGHLQMMVTWPGEEMKPVHQYLSEYHAAGKPQGVWK